MSIQHRRNGQAKWEINLLMYGYLFGVPLWIVVGGWVYIVTLADRLGSPSRADSSRVADYTLADPGEPVDIGTAVPPVPLSQFNLHTLIVGTPGSGKTTHMLHVVNELARRGVGTFFIDPKSDAGARYVLAQIAGGTGGWDRFLWVDLADPARGATYNPLLRGTPAALKDKIVSAFNWTEAYYQKRAEEALLSVFLAAAEAGVSLTFRDLYLLFRDKVALYAFADMASDASTRNAVRDIATYFKDLAGLTADLHAIDASFPMTRTYEPSLDILDAYTQGRIVYVGLATNAYTETSWKFGRILVNDFKAATAELQAHPADRRLYAVVIDEFASLANPALTSWLEQCRSAGFCVFALCQSLGDLEQVSPAFKSQVIDNTATKIVFQVGDWKTAEDVARIIGTREGEVQTRQVEEFLGRWETGRGTVTPTRDFIAHPDEIKNLGQHEAVLSIRGVMSFAGRSGMRSMYPDGGERTWKCPDASKTPAITRRGLHAEELVAKPIPRPPAQEKRESPAPKKATRRTAVPAAGDGPPKASGKGPQPPRPAPPSPPRAKKPEVPNEPPDILSQPPPPTD